MPTAAIVGAGVAGLTTAHELAERGYDVTVYERQAILGGKARSVTVPGSGTDGRGDLPGEHGFRFFPRFYRHVVDTMSRIPYRGNRDGVAGNLVGASEGLFAQQRRPGLIVGTGLPTTEAELRVFLRTWLDNVWALSRRSTSSSPPACGRSCRAARTAASASTSGSCGRTSSASTASPTGTASCSARR